MPVGTSNSSLSWLKKIELCANIKMQMRVIDISGPFASDSDLKKGKYGDVSKLARMFYFPV